MASPFIIPPKTMFLNDRPTHACLRYRFWAGDKDNIAIIPSDSTANNSNGPTTASLSPSSRIPFFLQDAIPFNRNRFERNSKFQRLTPKTLSSATRYLDGRFDLFSPSSSSSSSSMVGDTKASETTSSYLDNPLVSLVHGLEGLEHYHHLGNEEILRTAAQNYILRFNIRFMLLNRVMDTEPFDFVQTNVSVNRNNDSIKREFHNAQYNITLTMILEHHPSDHRPCLITHIQFGEALRLYLEPYWILALSFLNTRSALNMHLLMTEPKHRASITTAAAATVKIVSPPSSVKTGQHTSLFISRQPPKRKRPDEDNGDAARYYDGLVPDTILPEAEKSRKEGGGGGGLSASSMPSSPSLSSYSSPSMSIRCRNPYYGDAAGDCSTGSPQTITTEQDYAARLLLSLASQSPRTAKRPRRELGGRFHVFAQIDPDYNKFRVFLSQKKQ